MIDANLKRPNLSGLPLSRLLPNAVTLLSLASGLSAIRFAIGEKWEAAVIAILLAGIFDALDGRLARMLGTASKFGAELDSLADVISFGVAPSIVLYLWTLGHAGSIGWIASLAFAMCCALRLARFNTMLENPDAPAWTKHYFTGVPAPAGASLAILPMVMSFEMGRGIVDQPYAVTLWTVIVGGLMVSRLPTFAMKGRRIPVSMVLPLLLVTGLIAAALTVNPWLTLTAVAIFYLSSMPFSLRHYRKEMRQEENKPV